ncbi:hypothetical protein B0J18DRAFT_268222 [Chaetomium sp. MPI-SDFR-AT-0129]|nr:hypothetical protein B0J18DRAFT_268222 [Chaetomium sp. MPI-SDFR-AT-0129]
MPPYYYHIKFELYPTPNPAAANGTEKTNAGGSILSRFNPAPTSTLDSDADRDRDHDREIWRPTPGASIFDELPSHPHKPHAAARPIPRGWKQWKNLDGSSSADQTQGRQHGPDRDGAHNKYGDNEYHDTDGRPKTYAATAAAAAAANSRVIDCGSRRGRRHKDTRVVAEEEEEEDRQAYAIRPNNGQPRSLRRSSSSPPPGSETDGIGPDQAVRDWRFGIVRLESYDLEEGNKNRNDNNNNPANMVGENNVHRAAMATPAASLGPNLGGMGLATKARYAPLETKNTEAGWGVVHLYREGEESADMRADQQGLHEGVTDEGHGKEVDTGVGGDEDGTILCIPAVPSYMSPSDFLGFVGERWRGYVSHYRMVMTSRMSRYMVLMKFRDSRNAKVWRKEFDGKPFDSIETEICHVTFIKSIIVDTPNHSGGQRKHSEANNEYFSPASPLATHLKPFPPPTPDLTELPTCAVCLERMDDTAGLMTNLCQHVFHCTCLQTWKGSGCPVCRATNPKPAEEYDRDNPYSQPFGSGVSNICANCNCTDDLWICLICGNVGCGRYNGGHAKEHWKRTAHSFSLELQTQHVWDYAGDMWVHRLIRDKGDGKVVELPRNDINDRQPPGSGGRGNGGNPLQEDVVPRAKLDTIGLEYTHLLTSQLESQRVYFEEMVNKAADKAAKASAAAESASVQASEALQQLATLREEHHILRDQTIPSLERELAKEKARATKSSELARNMGKALQEEKEVSAGLMKRIEHIQGESAGAGRAVEQLRAENEELKEMNRDLTMFISGQEKLKEMEKEGMVQQGELEDGTVAVPEGSGSGGGKRKGKGRKK